MKRECLGGAGAESAHEEAVECDWRTRSGRETAPRRDVLTAYTRTISHASADTR